MRYITVLNIAGRTVAAAAVFIFVRRPDDYLTAAFLQSVGFVIAGVLSAWVVSRRFSIKLRRPESWSYLRNQMGESTQVFVASLAGNVYGQGGILITGLIAGNTAAGFYALSQKIATAVVGLVQPVSQGLYPRLCKLFAEDGTAFRGTRRRVIALGATVGVGCGIPLFAFAQPVGRIVSGVAHPELVLLIKIQSAVLVFTIMNVLLNPFMLAMKRYAANQKLSIAAALVFLMLSIPATSYLGGPGMACTMIIIEAMVLTGIVVITHHSSCPPRFEKRSVM